jgi:hypothetical protein
MRANSLRMVVLIELDCLEAILGQPGKVPSPVNTFVANGSSHWRVTGGLTVLRGYRGMTSVAVWDTLRPCETLVVHPRNSFRSLDTYQIERQKHWECFDPLHAPRQLWLAHADLLVTAEGMGEESHPVQRVLLHSWFAYFACKRTIFMMRS